MYVWFVLNLCLKRCTNKINATYAKLRCNDDKQVKSNWTERPSLTSDDSAIAESIAIKYAVIRYKYSLLLDPFW